MKPRTSNQSATAGIVDRLRGQGGAGAPPPPPTPGGLFFARFPLQGSECGFLDVRIIPSASTLQLFTQPENLNETAPIRHS